MHIEKIYSRNATYQKFEVLKSNRQKRHKYQQFFVEGVRNINEAIRNHWVICSFIYSSNPTLSHWANGVLAATKTDINYVLTPELMAELSSKTDTSELLAIVQMRDDVFDSLKVTKDSTYVLFDRPSNKGNLGTIIRSCDSFGIQGLIICGHAVDYYDPDVIAATMGSFFSVPVVRVSELEPLYRFIDHLKTLYPCCKMIGTTAHKEKSIQDIPLSTPIILMLGNETDGLNRTFTELCDVMATIPMSENSSASSLNVACAATVLMYEVERQRLTGLATTLENS